MTKAVDVLNYIVTLNEVQMLFEILPSLMQKIGLPSQSDTQNSKYSQMDYDDDEQFLADLIRFRDNCNVMVRQIFVGHPQKVFRFVVRWMDEKVFCDVTAVRETKDENTLRLIVGVLNSVSKTPMQDDPDFAKFIVKYFGLACSSLEVIKDEAIINSRLSLISYMFPFAKYLANEDFARYLRTIIQVSIGPEFANTCRNHSMFLLVKVSVEFPELLIAYRSDLQREFMNVSSQLSHRQMCYVAEILVALSSYADDFDSMERLIEQMSLPAKNYFNSPEIIRCLNGIYQSSCVNILHSAYNGSQVLDIPKGERFAIMAIIRPIDIRLGMNEMALNRTDSDKMFPRLTVAQHIQGFLSDISDNLQTLLGCCISKFSSQFYTLPYSSIYLSESLLPTLATVPSQFIGQVLPALSLLLSHCYQRLSARWQYVDERESAGEEPESVEASKQSIFVEHMATILTRELITCLRKALLADEAIASAQKLNAARCSTASLNIETAVVDEIMSDPDACDPTSPGTASPNGVAPTAASADLLSELGKRMCEPQAECHVPLILLLFHCLVWGDSVSAVAALPLCKVVMSRLNSFGLLDEAAVLHLFKCVLSGLGRHGQHQYVSMMVTELSRYLYETLVSSYPKIREELRALPEFCEQDLEKYEYRAFSSKFKAFKSNRVKRELYRKVVKGALGSQAAGN
ncbi:unnamed protein product [Soboliphyme baturini]|uniref:Exportin-5 domain-containing protein n=1 Tax=Soboliphyme baturini TaxID=241478 RepID=A0A183ILN8_9BILA|nr:unnamed protein product [Soboliphyme baturini]